MRPFVLTLQDGKRVLGVGLSSEDLDRIKAGEWTTVDLGDTGTGFWYSTEEGREFCQPRNSQVILTLGDSVEEIGKVLGLQMPDTDAIKRDGV
jgi:hypothetical protein